MFGYGSRLLSDNYLEKLTSEIDRPREQAVSISVHHLHCFSAVDNESSHNSQAITVVFVYRNTLASAA